MEDSAVAVEPVDDNPPSLRPRTEHELDNLTPDLVSQWVLRQGEKVASLIDQMVDYEGRGMRIKRLIKSTRRANGRALASGNKIRKLLRQNACMIKSLEEKNSLLISQQDECERKVAKLKLE